MLTTKAPSSSAGPRTATKDPLKKKKTNAIWNILHTRKRQVQMHIASRIGFKSVVPCQATGAWYSPHMAVAYEALSEQCPKA